MVYFPGKKVDENRAFEQTDKKVDMPLPIASNSLFKKKILPEEGVASAPSAPPSMGKYKIVPDPASNPRSNFPKKVSNRTKVISKIMSSIVSTVTRTETKATPSRMTQVAPSSIVKVDSKDTVASGSSGDIINLEISDDTGE